MKLPLFLPLLLASCAMLVPASRAADTPSVAAIADGAPSPPAAPAPAPSTPVFTIFNTVQRQLGSRTVTIQRVQGPAWSASATTTAAAAPTDAATPATAGADAEEDVAPPLFLQATVVDHRATLLSWWHDGREYRAWSNVDFNHLTGFNEFEKGSRHFFVIMAVADADAASLTIPADAPTPGGPAAFRLFAGAGSPDDAATCETVRALHELYDAEGPRLRAAHASREQWRLRREAEAALAPPPPPPVVIRYWKEERQGGTP